MKRIIALANLALFAAILLAGCSSKNPIVGQWINDETAAETIFFTDGSMVVKFQGFIHEGTYSLAGNHIKLSTSGEIVLGDYRINGETLTITTEGRTGTYRKGK